MEILRSFANPKIHPTQINSLSPQKQHIKFFQLPSKAWKILAASSLLYFVGGTS
jgi:hypothetical protein